jgi:hypothetical protein
MRTRPIPHPAVATPERTDCAIVARTLTIQFLLADRPALEQVTPAGIHGYKPVSLAVNEDSRTGRGDVEVVVVVTVRSHIQPVRCTGV